MKKTINLILGFVLLATLVYIAYVIGKMILETFAGLNSSLQTAVASALSLVIVASIGFFANKAIEQKKSIEASVRPRKLELYEEFISFFLKVLSNGKVYPKPTEKEIMKFYTDSNPLLMSFASNKVIKKWGKLRLKMSDDDGINNMFQLEDLLVEIRKDLGHSTRDFKKGDILRLVVNDVDDHLEVK